MRSSLFLNVTQRRLVFSYRRLGTNYQSHRQGSISTRRNFRPSAMLLSVDLKTEIVQASRYLVEFLQRASADRKAPRFAGNNKTGVGGADIHVARGIRTQVAKEAPFPALLVH